MTNEIVKHEVNLDEIQRMAKMMVVSGYFDAAKDMTQGIAQMAIKIMAGHEMGYKPFASVQGIHVIQGKPTVSVNLMAAAIKNHPRYDYRVRKMSNEIVSIEFFENEESLGLSEFTAQDALAAGLGSKDIWKKFPRNMLFARALSNGVRWYTPDVFNGNTVYTPDELGATVDYETGEIIEQSANADHQLTDTQPDAGEQPEPEQVDVKPPQRASEAQRNKFHAIGSQIYGDGWDDARHKLVSEISGGQTTTSNDLLPGECNELMLDMLGYAAFGDGWADKVASLCKSKKVVALRGLEQKTVDETIGRLQNRLASKPVEAAF